MIRLACLGAGYFAQFHYEAWRRINGVELVAASDHDLAKAQATGLQAFDELEAMLTQTKPDVLDIITPPPSHAFAIRAALAKGIKWIICQKPFCQSLEEARAVTQEAEAAGAVLIVHENFRFQPWYRCIKQELDRGLIGQLMQITFRLRPGDGQGADAYLARQPYFQTMPKFLVHETGVHWIDTFRYLAGDPEAVYADLRKVNPVIAGEDAGYLVFDHPQGVRALFDGNRCLDHAADNHRRTMGEALIEGEQGSLSLKGDGSVHFRGFGSQTSQKILPASSWDGFGGDCVGALQSHVIAAMQGQGAIENQAASYLKVIEIEEAIYRSDAQGQKLAIGGTKR